MPLNMTVLACVAASCSCFETYLEENAIAALGEEPSEPLIAGDFSAPTVGEEEVQLSEKWL